MRGCVSGWEWGCQPQNGTSTAAAGFPLAKEIGWQLLVPIKIRECVHGEKTDKPRNV